MGDTLYSYPPSLPWFWGVRIPELGVVWHVRLGHCCLFWLYSRKGQVLFLQNKGLWFVNVVSICCEQAVFDPEIIVGSSSILRSPASFRIFCPSILLISSWKTAASSILAKAIRYCSWFSRDRKFVFWRNKSTISTYNVLISGFLFAVTSNKWNLRSTVLSLCLFILKLFSPGSTVAKTDRNTGPYWMLQLKWNKNLHVTINLLL